MRSSLSNLILTFAVAIVVFSHTGPSKSQENLLHYNSTTEALTGKNDSDEFPLPVGRLVFSMMPVSSSVTRFIALETFHVSFARVSSNHLLEEYNLD